MTSGNFKNCNDPNFSPEYGGVKWVRRLNMLLESSGVELEPVSYSEKGKPEMAINQENCHVYINQIADEMDCISVRYDEDNGPWTFYWREVVEKNGNVSFEQLTAFVGDWAMNIVTLYPLEHIVEQYENFFDKDIPNEVPEGWE